MSNFNRVILVGRLTRDPEIRYTPSGMQLAKFGLAVSRPRSKNNETDFFNITAWGKLAEICGNFLRKGRLVLIEGEININKYETQDGQKRQSVDIRAGQMQMLESKRQATDYDQQRGGGYGGQQGGYQGGQQGGYGAPQGGYQGNQGNQGGYGSAPPRSPSPGVEELDVADLGVDEFDAEDMPF